MLEQFKKEASMASFHYADDTRLEWGKARERADNALSIYESAPDSEKKEMREYMKGQLWLRYFNQKIEGTCDGI